MVPEVVIPTISGAASDDKVGIMASLDFDYNKDSHIGLWKA